MKKGMIKIRIDCPDCGKEIWKGKGMLLFLKIEERHRIVYHALDTEDLSHLVAYLKDKILSMEKPIDNADHNDEDAPH